MNNPEKYMKIAYKLAQKAAEQDEAPIGCVIVYQDKVIARGYNTRKKNESTIDRKSTRLNSSHIATSRMPSSA